MLKSKKKLVIDQIQSIYSEYSTFIVVRYQGLNTSDLSVLRSSLREIQSSFKIVKNSLSIRASVNSNIDHISQMLKGPVGIAYSHDPISLAKKVISFSDTKENLKVMGGVIDKEFYDADKVLSLSKLPSLDEIRSDIVSTLSFVPSNLFGVLKHHTSEIVRVMEAYSSRGD